MIAIIILVFVTITVASPPQVQILRSYNNLSPDGSYTYSFETDDGYTREETGSVVNPGNENAFVAVVGSYKYIDPDGHVVEVHYSADDRGFVPFDFHISEDIKNNAKLLSQTKTV